jgi:hypothetical protein
VQSLYIFSTALRAPIGSILVGTQQATKGGMCAQVRIDHKMGSVHFGALQLESERLHDIISTLARRLAKALSIINPEPTPSKAEFKTKVIRPLYSAWGPGPWMTL